MFIKKCQSKHQRRVILLQPQLHNHQWCTPSEDCVTRDPNHIGILFRDSVEAEIPRLTQPGSRPVYAKPNAGIPSQDRLICTPSCGVRRSATGYGVEHWVWGIDAYIGNPPEWPAALPYISPYEAGHAN